MLPRIYGMAVLSVLLTCQALTPAQHAPPVSLGLSRDESPPCGHAIIATGVPNLMEVTPMLYRGGQPNTAGMQALADLGIGIVVDGREFHKRERDEVNRVGMQYVAIPWHCPFPKDEVFARFLDLIRQNPTKKIFVHCRLGDDRVGMMIAAYRMAVENWTAEEAMREMKANGFKFGHHFICPGLAKYEKEFPARYKTNPIFRSR